MTTQPRQPVPACALHAWRFCICLVITLVLAADAPAEMIGVSGYDSWRWNGFALSSPTDNESSVSALSVAWDAVSPASNSPTALLSSSGTVGASSYNSWQWGGFSRSSPYAPTNDAPAVSLVSSSSSLLLLQSAEVSDEGILINSLSGYVYFDENCNGIMETTDWAIVDATLSLTKQGSGGLPLVTYTDTNGEYTFDGLSPGTYAIALLTPCPEPGVVVLGQLYDADGNVVPDAGKVTDVGFYDIVMEDGYQGVNYIFCESTYPVDAVSKRLLIEGGPNHTVPEPTTLVLLAAAGLVIGAYSRRRK